MSREPRALLLFGSIHDVLHAEKQVKLAGLWCDLVPIPKTLSADCGMAIEVRPQDIAALDLVRGKLPPHRLASEAAPVGARAD